MKVKKKILCYTGFCSDLLLDTLCSPTTQMIVKLSVMIFFVALRPNAGHGLLILEV